MRGFRNHPQDCLDAVDIPDVQEPSTYHLLRIELRETILDIDCQTGTGDRTPRPSMRSFNTIPDYIASSTHREDSLAEYFQRQKPFLKVVRVQ